MRRVGVWERDEGLCRVIEETLRRSGKPLPLFLRGRHPAELAGENLDLLVVSPAATGWAGAASVTCRMVLLPGGAGPMVRGMHVESAVSYGAGPRNTITLSSLERDRICLAIQRELVTVEGCVVDRQELVLPFPAGRETPDLFMARTGALLLLGCDVSALWEQVQPA